jgi:hypothetical protein
MAEGVRIEFEADLSNVRAALDRFVQDARHRRVDIPVGVGGGGGGSVATAGVGGGTPTAAGVLGTPAGAFGRPAPTAAGGFFATASGFPSVAGSPLPAVDRGAAGAFAGAGGGGAFATALAVGRPTLADLDRQDRSFNQGVRALARGEAAALRNQTGREHLTPPGFWGGYPSTSTAAAGGAGRTPAPRPGILSRVNQFGRDRGIGDLLGYGSVIAGAGNLYAGEREYQVAMQLAGTDSRAQFDALMGKREAVAGSFGGISRGFAAIKDWDWSGRKEAAVAATAKSADLGDQRTAFNQDRARAQIVQREREFEASTVDPYEKRVRAAKNAYNEEIRLAEDKLRRLAALDNQQIAAEIAAGRMQQGDEPAERKRRADRRADMLKEDVTAAGRYRDVEVAKVDWIESRRRTAALAETAFQVRGDIAGIFGDAAGERRIGRAAGNFRQITQAGQRLQDVLSSSPGGDLQDVARRFGRIGNVLGETAATTGGVLVGELRSALDERRESFFRSEDSRRRTRALEYGLDRDPERSALASLDAERLEATRGRSVDEAAQINREFAARRGGIVASFRDRREMQERALAGEGRVLDAALGGGRFAELRSAAVSAREQAFLRSEELRREDASGSVGARRLTLENAAKEVQLLQRDFVRQFRPEEVSINRVALDEKSNKGTQDAINETNKILADIRAELRNVGRAQ